MKAFKIFLILWIVIWIFFIIRPFVIDRDLLSQYLKLANASQEERRAIVYGKDFYEFLKFCKMNMPEDSTFQFVGIVWDSVDVPRMIYYLYPRLIVWDPLETPRINPISSNKRPDFILVYKNSLFSKDGTVRFATLDSESFILKTK